jgi:hypothetical protein
MRLILASLTGLVVGYLPVGVALLFPQLGPWGLYVGALGALMGAVAGFVAALLRPGRWVELAAAVVWLGILPAIGFAVDTTIDPCTEPCSSIYQPVAWPGAWAVIAGYLLGLAAFATGWRRPGPLPVHLEGLLLWGLGMGATTCALVALQFVPMLTGAVFMPPLLCPALACLVFVASGLRRLQRTGARGAPMASMAMATCLGAWAVASGLLRGAFRPFGGGLADTCGYTFSTMQPPVGDCHYLCTVAAQGHPWLVRPTRLGRRRGRVIVVNRQLAVANAFEDLLHQRWPRVGRSARTLYDRLAFEVSRQVRRRWVADLVFVAMLPAQLGFELVLVWLDPGDPEVRIDRMYR